MNLQVDHMDVNADWSTGFGWWPVKTASHYSRSIFSAFSKIWNGLCDRFELGKKGSFMSGPNVF